MKVGKQWRKDDIKDVERKKWKINVDVCGVGGAYKKMDLFRVSGSWG